MVESSTRSVGYVPHGPDLKRPMDRRRFPRYAARRGLQFEIVSDWDDRDMTGQDSCDGSTPAADMPTHEY